MTMQSPKFKLMKKLEWVRDFENFGLIQSEVVSQYQMKLLNEDLEKAIDEEMATEATPPQINASANIPIPHYRNFDLVLSKKQEGQLYVEVLASPDESGGNGTTTLPPYGTIRIEPGGLTRNLRPLDPADINLTPDRAITLRSLGEIIGRAMLPENVRLCFDRNLATATHVGEGLRVRLRIQHEDVAAIPWEVARIGEDFLALRPRTPMVRYIVLNEAPTPVRVNGPLNVLGIVSEPTDLPSIGDAEEQAQLRNALEPLIKTERIHLEWLPDGDPDLLQEWLRNYKPHILHYIGHGSYDHKLEEGSLWFKDKNTTKKSPRSAHWLATLLRDSTVRFVFLNACDSAHAAGGLSEHLVRRGVPAVLGMQTAVLDEVAIAFACEFYRSLADRYPVDLALVEGRKAVFNLLVNENDLARPDWAEPALYMSAPDGELFE